MSIIEGQRGGPPAQILPPALQSDKPTRREDTYVMRREYGSELLSIIWFHLELLLFINIPFSITGPGVGECDKL